MDQALVMAAQGGDRAAFEDIVVSEHRRLFALAQGILRDPTVAEDATQQAFVDIWRDLPALRDPSRFEAWSYRVLVRVCYREARRAPDWIPDDSVSPGHIPIVADPSGGVIERESIERGFARLSTEHRVVLVMRFLLDMTPDEIAATLGIGRRTVYSRTKRAIAAMRAALEADARPTPPISEQLEATR